MSELKQLKGKASKLYKRAMAFDDLDCGRSMAETIRPEIYTARMEFKEVWKQIKELDPNAPDNPLE